MKLTRPIRLLILIMVGVLACGLAYVLVIKQIDPVESRVVVKRFDIQFPADTNKASEFLWNNFSDRPELRKFAKESGDGWSAKFHRHQWFLVAKAHLKLLDATLLDNCLSEVFKDAKTTNTGLAYLPVAAYAAKQGSTDVWIIVVKWECVGFFSNDEPSGYELSHIRMFAFDAKTHKVIGFSTCM
jgi:hypothetical protein